MKLAVNTVIFGLNEAVAEALVLAERNGIDRALAYDVLAASAVGAPIVGYKRAAFVEPGRRRRSPSRSRSRTRTCGLIRAARRRLRHGDAPGRDQSRDDPGRGADRRASDADFSMVASHLREEGRR